MRNTIVKGESVGNCMLFPGKRRSCGGIRRDFMGFSTLIRGNRPGFSRSGGLATCEMLLEDLSKGSRAGE